MIKSSLSQEKWVNKLIFLFLILFTAILYINLGRDALFDWDEGIYAQLGSELIRSKNLFVTFWNGSTWFEKPPGIAWLSAFGQTIAGHNPFGARLFQPLISASVLMMVYFIGKKLSSWQTAIMAAAILAGFNLFLGRTRAVNTDMPLLFGITGTVAALLYNKKPIIVALIVAFSVWFKGLAGLMPVLISLPLLYEKGWKYTLRTALFSLILILPWHLYAYYSYGGDFLTPYIKEQVLARVTNPIEFHLESRWFYFKYLYENLGLGIIIVAMIGVFLLIPKTVKMTQNRKLSTFNFQTLTILWWVIVPIVIFTLAKTRLFWYILPVYPAIALLSAYAIDNISQNSKAKSIVSCIAGLLLIQSLTLVYRSVEPDKKSAVIPDRLQIAESLSVYKDKELAVLVPHEERMAEAILPQNQRIGSSFRYGGMPSVVYYYDGLVKFFYNVDEFREYWMSASDAVAMIHKNDINVVPSGYRTIHESNQYLGIRKGVYAQR